MQELAALGRWVAENEALLSGLVSLVVLVGLVLSPFGKGLRRLVTRAEEPGDDPAPSAQAVAPAPAVPRADPTDPLLAVLAFDNLSSDGEMQFFCDGVSDEIIQRLSRGAHLKVIGRTTSFQFRGERKGEAADALGCSHVLDGSVRRAGKRVRISAHLLAVDSQTTLWSDHYDRGLEDVFAVQDEISDHIAEALDRAFASFSTPDVEPAVYDLYLRALPQSYAPDELRARISLLEEATRRAPHFAEAWGRLSFLRGWLSFYLPFAERATFATRVEDAAQRARAIDPDNAEAITGALFVKPPFGHFLEGDPVLERVRRSPGADRVRSYIGWYLRTTGHVGASIEEAERAYRLDRLDPLSANLTALARMAAGRPGDAVPLFEDLVERVPEMSFPVANLLRARAFQEDWDEVDRLLDLAKRRELRELEAGLPFIRTKRDPTPERLAAWRDALASDVAASGCVDLSRLVYTAHLGLVDAAYEAAEGAWLGPTGGPQDVMGPDGYRTSFLFQASMPELRDDPRFPRLCARLGLVEFWTTTGKWPDCADELPYDLRAECERLRDHPKDDFAARLAGG